MNIQLDRTTPHTVDNTTPEAQPLASAGKTATTKSDIVFQDGASVPLTVAQEDTAPSNGAPIPPLPTRSASLTLTEYAAFPALGASYMVLMTETQSQQRRLSAQQRAMETDITCANMNEQANKMRSKAVTGLVFGLVTSSLSIGQAFVSAATLQKGMNKIAEESKMVAVKPDANAKIDPNANIKIDPKVKADANIEMEIKIEPKVEAKIEPKVDARVEPKVEAKVEPKVDAKVEVKADADAKASAVDIQNKQMLLNQKLGMQNAVFSAGSSSIGKTGEAITGFMDVDIKRSEITIERSRANVEALRALEESSQAVISKALATMDAIQSSTNQATQRILG